MLEERIPANLRTAHLVRVLDPRPRHRLQQGRVKPEQVQTYADLAKPALKGKVCMRSGSTPTTCR
jgi:iron(III) transport system substrate-binding protein